MATGAAAPKARPPGSSQGQGSRDRLQIPELPSSTDNLPRTTLDQDTEAVLKRLVRRKQPSIHRLKDRERMLCPAWATLLPSTLLPSSDQTKQPPGRREELPVYLPSLKYSTKEKASRLLKQMTQAEQKATTATQPSSTDNLPRTPLVQDRQAVLKIRVKGKQPSDGEQMFFPGSDTLLPSPDQTKQPPVMGGKLPVHLPSSKYSTKYERRLGEYQEKAIRLLTQFLQDEEKATTATQPSSNDNLPRTPLVQDTQAVVKRLVKGNQPSIHHLKDDEQMFFPGWDTLWPSFDQAKQPTVRRGKLPVHLPSLKYSTKISQNVVPTSTVPTWPFSLKSVKLDTPSDLNVIELNGYIYSHKSQNGVVSVVRKKADFEARKQWEEQYNFYLKLINNPWFRNFRKFKAFRVWRVRIRAKKTEMARRSVEKCLFFVKPSLRCALLDIRKLCNQIGNTSLCHIEEQHTYTLKEFQDIQSKQLQEVLSDLRKFQDLVKEVTVCACQNYAIELNANPVKFEYDPLSRIPFQYKRQICFIRLVDYLVIDTLLSLLLSSVAKLLTVFQGHACQTPSNAVIQSWSRSSEGDPSEEVMSQKSETRCWPPVFISELMMDPHALTYKPSEEEFHKTIAEIIGSFRKTLMSVNMLTEDPDLMALISPEGIENFENQDEHGPCLEWIMNNDGQLQRMTQKIKESFQFAFDAAKVYSDTFERFSMFYREFESLDLDVIRQKDHDMSFFEKALELQHSVHKDATAIQPKRHLGLLLVDKTQFKKKIVYSQLAHIQVINEMLTVQARKKLDAFIAELYDAQYKLESGASTIAELANSVTFLDEIQKRVTGLEAEQETISQMYSLINKYSIALPCEDMVVFATLHASMDSLHKSIIEAEFVRDSSIEKLGMED